MFFCCCCCYIAGEEFHKVIQVTQDTITPLLLNQLSSICVPHKMPRLSIVDFWSLYGCVFEAVFNVLGLKRLGKQFFVDTLFYYYYFFFVRTATQTTTIVIPPIYLDFHSSKQAL